MNKIRILVVGCGNMGYSHALAYHQLDDFEIVGVVDRGPESRKRVSDALGGLPEFSDYQEALTETKPDAVSINTYPDTHAEYAIAAIDASAHVFVEKPLAETVEQAQAIADKAKATGRKVVVGYILRHHPSWSKFVELAHTLGKPLVMRMNLNQQSSGDNWGTHKHLLASMSPIVDCGVHYVDMMCLMTESRPTQVQAIGARLSDEIDAEMYNYGQLQVKFEDGSVGWYEAGWGPMMSETAYFVKDVIGPQGSVTIVTPEKETGSDDVDSHCQTNQLLFHHAELGPDGKFTREDELIDTADEPDHYALCKLEQEYFLKAIKEDLDLSKHVEDAVNSLRIVLAADESFRTGEVVKL